MSSLVSGFVDFVYAIAYSAGIGIVGAAFNLADVVVNWWCWLVFGTSVVNVPGSGPIFDLDKLGLDLKRAFSPSDVDFHGEHPVCGMDVTERDVVCSLLCKLSYETPFKRRQVFGDWLRQEHLPALGGFDKLYKDFSYKSAQSDYWWFRTNGVFNTSAYVLRVTADTVVICFRGTQPFDLIQWFTDASIKQREPLYVEHGKVKVHRGFAAALGLNLKPQAGDKPKYNVFFKVMEDVSKYLSPFLPKKLIQPTMVYQLVEHVSALIKDHQVENVIITGHSLGAALAQQFAFAIRCVSSQKLKELGWHPDTPLVAERVQGIYTYGTPRSGNGAFAKAFDAAYQNVIVHRVVNNDDVVGRVPLTNVRLELQLQKRTVQFFYRATKGLIYLRVGYPRVDGTDSVAESKQNGVNGHSQCHDSEEEHVFVVAPSKIPDRWDDPLGFIFGVTSILDHYPSSYCDRLADIWRYEARPRHAKASGTNGFTPPAPYMESEDEAHSVAGTPVSVKKSDSIGLRVIFYLLFSFFNARVHADDSE